MRYLLIFCLATSVLSTDVIAAPADTPAIQKDSGIVITAPIYRVPDDSLKSSKQDSSTPTDTPSALKIAGWIFFALFALYALSMDIGWIWDRVRSTFSRRH